MLAKPTGKTSILTLNNRASLTNEDLPTHVQSSGLKIHSFILVHNKRVQSKKARTKQIYIKIIEPMSTTTDTKRPVNKGYDKR
ncbi:hypothetical protein PILCRDRAFT_713953 [Piloderma croceum F 1598]|uniref:Uncharacterized protein n=1 Tax=Piloderma croceum (strain F 1598) TaxID=765440 RepID=A0A0C3B9R5_PILCF|nr:hypothetical protein PILCRDRAFT_713953 [Piloderma croceum F 1598]